MMKLFFLKNLKRLAVVLLLSITSHVNANALFDFAGSSMPFPDIFSSGLNVDYNAASGNFNIFSNTPSTFGNYAVSASENEFFAGTFLLGFSVDSSGTLDSPGAFSITDVATFLPALNGIGASTLLSGFVTDFGFSNNTFEVLLNITSGFLAPEFGLDAGVIVSGDFTGFSFASNFSQIALADTFKVTQVPEPSILILFAIAGLSFFRVGQQG